jgi:hypothetical protein
MLQYDIWIAVNALLKLYGNDAAAHAAGRVDRFVAKGDEASCMIWRQVLQALNDWMNTEPGGPVN